MIKCKLVAFEGIDGSGKTSTIRKLSDTFREKNLKVLTDTLILVMPKVFKEIGRQQTYKELKHIAYTIESVVRFNNNLKTYETYDYVLFDRWYYSESVYLPQINYYGNIFNQIKGILPIPDKVIYFDITPECALDRLKQKNDWMLNVYNEDELIKLLTEYKDRYEDFFLKNQIEIKRIDASKTQEELLNDIMNVLS